MLNIAIADTNFEIRSNIENTLREIMSARCLQGIDLPEMHFFPFDPNSTSFAGMPDLFIVGPTLCNSDISRLNTLINRYSNVPFIAYLDSNEFQLTNLTKLKNVGVVDTITSKVDAEELANRILFRYTTKKRQGNSSLIVVDSGKGGSGVTSFAGGLADNLSQSGFKTLLIDLDYRYQSLSRFFRISYPKNEKLTSLLEGQEVINIVSVNESIRKLYDNVENLFILTPFYKSQSYFLHSTDTQKRLSQILSVLDNQFDYIVVDMAHIDGVFAETFYMASNYLLLLSQLEKSSILNTITKIKDIRSITSNDQVLEVIATNYPSSSYSFGRLKKDLVDCLDPSSFNVYKTQLSYQKGNSKWPATGVSFFGFGNSSLREFFNGIVSHIVKPNEKKEQLTLPTILKLPDLRLKDALAKIVHASNNIINLLRKKDKSRETTVSNILETNVLKQRLIKGPNLKKTDGTVTSAEVFKFNGVKKMNTNKIKRKMRRERGITIMETIVTMAFSFGVGLAILYNISDKFQSIADKTIGWLDDAEQRLDEDLASR